MDVLQALESCDLGLQELTARLPGQTEPAYFRVKTLKDSERMEARLRVMGDTATSADKVASALILLVRDKNDKLCFTIADREALVKNAPESVLLEWLEQINSGPSLEEAEGN